MLIGQIFEDFWTLKVTFDHLNIYSNIMHHIKTLCEGCVIKKKQHCSGVDETHAGYVCTLLLGSFIFLSEGQPNPTRVT